MTTPVKLVVDLAADTGPTEAYVPMTSKELAQRDTDAAAAASAQQAATQRAFAALVAKCDRYLAQTDWIMLPSAARPVDMPAALAAAIDTNLSAWTTWRQAVRDLRSLASAGTQGALTQTFPQQPADPTVVLT